MNYDREPVFKRSKWGTQRYYYNPRNPIGLTLIIVSLLFAGTMMPHGEPGRPLRTGARAHMESATIRILVATTGEHPHTLAGPAAHQPARALSGQSAGAWPRELPSVLERWSTFFPRSTAPTSLRSVRRRSPACLAFAELRSPLQRRRSGHDFWGRQSRVRDQAVMN